MGVSLQTPHFCGGAAFGIGAVRRKFWHWQGIALQIGQLTREARARAPEAGAVPETKRRLSVRPEPKPHGASRSVFFTPIRIFFKKNLQNAFLKRIHM